MRVFDTFLRRFHKKEVASDGLVGEIVSVCRISDGLVLYTGRCAATAAGALRPGTVFGMAQSTSAAMRNVQAVARYIRKQQIKEKHHVQEGNGTDSRRD